MNNLLLHETTRTLDESEILIAEIDKELKEARCRKGRNEKRAKKQAKKRAGRQQDLEESLASNAAIQKGRELLNAHTNISLEEECKSLIREVQRQEVKFCELDDSLSKSVADPASSTVSVQRLEDRLDKHQVKIDQQKTAHQMYQAKMQKRDEEAANQEAKDKQAKDAFAALKAAKKAKRRKALRKSQTYPPSKSSSSQQKFSNMKRNLTA